MKPALSALITAVAWGLMAPAAQASHTKRPEVVIAIRAQAAAVQRDAAIYQRKRVAREVMRIESDVQKLDRLIAPHECLKSQRKQLQTAVRQLIRTSTDANADLAAQAAQNLFDLSGQISTATCQGTTD